MVDGRREVQIPVGLGPVQIVVVPRTFTAGRLVSRPVADPRGVVVPEVPSDIDITLRFLPETDKPEERPADLDGEGPGGVLVQFAGGIRRWIS